MFTLLTATTKRQIRRHSASCRELANCELEQPKRLSPQRRKISDHAHFYRNRQLELYAVKEARRLTLRQLVRSLLRKPPSGLSLRRNMKRNFLGLVWPLHDPRAIDHGERRLRTDLCRFNGFPHSLLSTPTQSANYVRTELPVRISHRLRDMQAIPYVVMTREGVSKVYEVRALAIRWFPSPLVYPATRLTSHVL